MTNNIPLDWQFLKDNHLKISILIDNPLPERIGEGKESYAGRVINFNDEFLVLETTNNARISIIVVKFNMIMSVWIYKPE